VVQHEVGDDAEHEREEPRARGDPADPAVGRLVSKLRLRVGKSEDDGVEDDGNGDDGENDVNREHEEVRVVDPVPQRNPRVRRL